MTESPNIPPPPRSALDRSTTRWVILGVLFLVTGFLGLPVLWISKSFSFREKIVWSIVNSIYTLTLIGLTALICWWAIRQIYA